MQSQYRLKKRNDFRQVFHSGRSFANRQFVVYVFTNYQSEHTRIGISVSRKVGNAVVRNRIKRLIKEIVRHWMPEVLSTKDIVVIARNPVATFDYDQMKSSLRHVFNKAKLFRNIPR